MRALSTIVLCFSTGCIAGKAGYYMVEAEQAYKLAEESGAAELAPFEFTLASEYRAKSLEEAGYSDYEPAEAYAKKVVEYAEEARQIALTGEPTRNMLEQMEADQSILPELVDQPFEAAPEPVQEEESPFLLDDEDDEGFFDDFLGEEEDE